MKDKIIIGLVGRRGSGKGTVAEQLRISYGAHVYRYSDTIRSILRLLQLEESREQLIRLSEILRNAYGHDLFSRILIKRIEQAPESMIVLDGIRRLSELEGMDGLGKFVLIKINTPLERRYRYLQGRGENVGETTRTLESFRALENAPTEMTIADVEARATATVENDADLPALEKKIDELMARLLS